jgi:uncharacterized membrane protein YheB (UPF0754 family)
LSIIQNYEVTSKVTLRWTVDATDPHRLNASLSEVMGQLSLSADVNVRTQLMVQIRAITNGNLLDISDTIKQILCERARDKIVMSFHQILPTIFIGFF